MVTQVGGLKLLQEFPIIDLTCLTNEFNGTNIQSLTDIVLCSQTLLSRGWHLAIFN